MFRFAVLAALLAAVGGGCASGESSADAGASRADVMPLADSGTHLPDGGGGDPDPDADMGEAAAPVINEFVASHAGTNSCEHFEIAGSASTSYAAYSVLVLDGDGGGDPGLVQHVAAVGTTDACV